MWRDPELEAIIGAPLDLAAWTETDVQRLVDNEVRESARIDFKSHPYSKNQNPDWPGNKELAKDVAAFANHLGGILVIGVEDTDGVATTLTPVNAATRSGEDEEQWVRQAVREQLVPLAQVETRVIPATAADHWYLVIAIRQSPMAPHAVRYATKDPKGRRPLCFPERDGADTRWLEEPEIADRYQLRREFVEAHRQRVDEVVRRGRHELRRSGDGVWVYVACVPEVVRDVGPDAPIVEAAAEWYQNDAPPKISLDSTVQLPWGVATPSAGAVSFSELEEIDGEGNQILKMDGVVDLYPSGPAFGALRLRAGDALNYPFFDIDELEQAITVAANLLLAWTVHAGGTWGSTTIVSGLDWAAAKDPTEWRFVPCRWGRTTGTLFDSGYSPVPHARIATDRPTSEVEADLADCTSQAGRLRLVHLLLRQVLQWFGILSPTILQLDGEFDSGWLQLNKYKRQTTIGQWTPRAESETST